MITKSSFSTYQKINALNISSLVNIKKSPAHFQWAKENPKDSKSLTLGRAIHQLILEPIDFNSVFAVEPDKNNFAVITADDLKPLCDKYSVKKAKTKGETINALCPFLTTEERAGIYDLAFDGFLLESEGKEILKHADYMTAKKISEKVLADPKIQKMLTRGKAEMNVHGTINGVECKGRIDFLGDGFILDVKSCRECSEKEFSRDFQNLMYAEKTSFYQKLVELSTGNKLPVVILAIETTEDCDFSFFEVEQDYLDHGFSEVEKMLETYKTCIEKNEWPSMDKDIKVLSKPAWLK